MRCGEAVWWKDDIGKKDWTHLYLEEGFVAVPSSRESHNDRHRNLVSPLAGVPCCHSNHPRPSSVSQPSIACGSRKL